MSAMARTVTVPVTLRRTAAMLTLLVATHGLTSCAGSSAMTESMRSDERPTADDAPGQGDGEGSGSSPSTEPVPTTTPRDEQAESSPDELREYCREMRDFASRPAAASQDPKDMLDSLRELRDLAPEELVDDFDRVLDTLEALDRFDEDDPSSFGGMLETLLDPELADSLAVIAERTLESCGVDIHGSGLQGLEGTEGRDGRGHHDRPGRGPRGRGPRD